MHDYRFHIGDYRRDTGHLTYEEHGMYRWLLDQSFLQETPLSPDIRVLMRKMGLTSDQKDTLQQLLDEFFELTEEGYVHSRVSDELSKAYEKSEKARASVNKRWAKHKRNTNVLRSNSDRNANEILPTYPPTHLPTNPVKDTAQKRSVKGARFEEFWTVYPTKKGKAKALQYWKRDNLDTMADALIEDVKQRIVRDDQWRRGYIPYPQRYINEKLWQDDYTPAKPDGKTIEQSAAASADKADRILRNTPRLIDDSDE